jgi:hypothetical protein
MSYASEVLADSPLVYLKLDETSGSTANDSSGNGYNFTYTSAAQLNSGVTADGSVAVGTDGTNAIAKYGSLVPGLGSPTAFTLEAYVYIETTVESGGFIAVGNNGGNGYGYGVGGPSSFEQTGNQFDGLADTLAWKNTGVNLGTGWRHVVLARDATGWFYYLGGSLVSSLSAQSIATATSEVYIGGYTAGGRALSAGNKMAHAAIYTSRLSGARIATHAAAGANYQIMDTLLAGAVGTQPSPFYPFGEGVSGGGAVVPTTGQTWPRGNW